MTPARTSLSWRPVVVGAACGLVVGGAMFAYDFAPSEQAAFATGLFLTYLSVGVLVTLLPRVGPRWAFGLTVGGLYSLPGSVFVAVPYPLRDDVPDFYRMFAGGGMGEFWMTLGFGVAVGLLCGLALPRPERARRRRLRPGNRMDTPVSGLPIVGGNQALSGNSERSRTRALRADREEREPSGRRS